MDYFTNRFLGMKKKSHFQRGQRYQVWTKNGHNYFHELKFPEQSKPFLAVEPSVGFNQIKDTFSLSDKQLEKYFLEWVLKHFGETYNKLMIF